MTGPADLLGQLADYECEHCGAIRWAVLDLDPLCVQCAVCGNVVERFGAWEPPTTTSGPTESGEAGR